MVASGDYIYTSLKKFLAYRWRYSESASSILSIDYNKTHAQFALGPLNSGANSISA